MYTVLHGLIFHNIVQISVLQNVGLHLQTLVSKVEAELPQLPNETYNAVTASFSLVLRNVNPQVKLSCYSGRI